MRLINERLLAFAPSDYEAALRLSRVYKVWADTEPSFERAEVHRTERAKWLTEALVRAPSSEDQQVIEAALAKLRVAGSSRAIARSRSVMRDLRVMTVPDELIRFARSLRDDAPQLPHLAFVASHRSVLYADKNSNSADPSVGFERYRARTSLAASLRNVGRAEDAMMISREAITLREKELPGWTTLVAATRQARGAEAACEALARALTRVDIDAAEKDMYFSRAAAAACEKAGRFGEATRWTRAELASLATRGQTNPSPGSREKAINRAKRLADLLREREQLSLARDLEDLIAATESSDTHRHDTVATPE